MALIFLLLLYSQNVGAQEQSYFWDIESEAETLLPYLKEALGDEANKQIFTAQDLKKHLEVRQLKTHACFSGVSKCGSPFSIVLDALKLSGVVTLQKKADGFHFALLDERKEVVREATIKYSKPKRAAYALISELFDATGTVVFISKPPGAEIRVDDKVRGITPFHLQLPVGQFQYTFSYKDFKSVDARFSLKKGQIKTIEETLKANTGQLTILDAPTDSEVFINGNREGFVGEKIELEPGSYTLQIRKDGYLSAFEDIEIKPGEQLNKNIVLERSNPFLRDVSTEAISHRKFVLRLSYEHGYQQATFQDARNSDNEILLGLTDTSGQLGLDEPLQTTLHTNGARLEFLYQLENFGLSFASISLLSGSANHRASVLSADGETRRNATITSSNRLQLRPFQLTYRRFYKNFVPTVELGLGVDLHWFNAALDGAETDASFSTRQAFWTFGIAGQYFLTNSLFGIARYSFQDYFSFGPGADHQFSIGLGIAFGNLFGVDPEPPEQL